MIVYGKERPDDLGVNNAGPDVPVEEDQTAEESGQAIIGQEQVDAALGTLEQYRAGKEDLTKQIIDNEEWYRVRHWDLIRKEKSNQEPEPASAWLFNTLQNKHADAMDHYPEPNILPREQQDEEDAKTLSDIVPVVLKRARYERTYRLNWWEKLKHGCGVYMPRWDNSLYNGLGDISIDRVDLLNIYWEPGIDYIQDSRNVFVVTLEDNDLLAQKYPEIAEKVGKAGISGLDVAQYNHDDNMSDICKDKTAVVDWYYKIQNENGREILHYCKIACDTLLFASQNDPAYADGWYHHGKFPFVFDTLFPEKGYPTGFGMIAICRDPQLYIDKLSANVMETSLINSSTRYFATDDLNINEDELLDVHKKIVHVSGGRLDPTRLQQIKGVPLDPAVPTVIESKINEMKETSANRDFSQGGTSGGVTAAAAINALQEAGNKVSRDMISGSYDEYTELTYMVLELIRQFYTEEREFRITGKDGSYKFTRFSSAGIQAQATTVDAMGNSLVREPVFDIEIKPQKRSAYAREAQNQRALELYAAGFFDPMNATPALTCLEMMEFEGIEQMRQKIAEGQTLNNVIQQQAATIADLSARLGLSMGAAAPLPEETEGNPAPGGSDSLPKQMAQAQQPSEPTGGI